MEGLALDSEGSYSATDTEKIFVTFTKGDPESLLEFDEIGIALNIKSIEESCPVVEESIVAEEVVSASEDTVEHDSTTNHEEN